MVDGKLVGTITSGDDPIAVVGASINGDRVILALDMGGAPGTITAVARHGRIDGEWELGGMTGKCVLTRTGDAAPASTIPQTQAKPQTFTRHPRLDVVVPDFPAEGLILDIGGGGEGVIGQLKGHQVVAIDLSQRGRGGGIPGTRRAHSPGRGSPPDGNRTSSVGATNGCAFAGSVSDCCSRNKISWASMIRCNSS